MVEGTPRSLVVPQGQINRLDHTVELSGLDRYQKVFEVIPCTIEQTEYVSEVLRSSLLRQYKDETVELPMYLAMADDVERELIIMAVDYMLRYDPEHPPRPEQQYKCQVVIQTWLEQHFRDLIHVLPHEAWIRELHFLDYVQLLEQFDRPTPLSMLIGSVPRFLHTGALQTLDIPAQDLPDWAECVLVRPFF